MFLEPVRPFPDYPDDGSGGYRIAGDTAVFDYDAMGNLILADNSDARIRRRYYPNGLLHTDTLRIRTVFGSNFTTHVYGLEYEYDLNGRPDTLRHPTNIAPVANALTRYRYDSATGALQAVIDPLGKGSSAITTTCGTRSTRCICRARPGSARRICTTPTAT